MWASLAILIRLSHSRLPVNPWQLQVLARKIVTVLLTSSAIQADRALLRVNA